ncbi:MAG: hypothetical protein GKS05_13200 [Nitrospirales bacterium]|nr:hypothetical protein [Nitrospirales bacterium]
MNVLSNNLNTFREIFIAGPGRLAETVDFLFYSFLAIELVIFGSMIALGNYNVGELFWKVLFISFWVWVIGNYDDLIGMLIGSFGQVGLLAGGGTITSDVLRDPSAIMGLSFEASQPLLAKINDFTVLNVGDHLTFGFLYLLLMIAFFIVALQVFLAYLEFYVLAGIGIIFMPFAINNHTRFLTEKAIGALVSSAVKIMILGFILTASFPVIQSVALPENPNYNAILTQITVVATIAFLAWNAPGMAAGLLAGSPSLTAGVAAQGAAVGALAALPLAGAALAGGSRAVAAGARMAASSMGMPSGIGSLGAATSMAGGGLGLSQAATTVGPQAGPLVSSVFSSTAPSSTANVNVGDASGGTRGPTYPSASAPGSSAPPSSSSPGAISPGSGASGAAASEKIETSTASGSSVTGSTQAASGPSTKGAGPSMPGWVEPGGSTRSRGQADPSTPPKWVEKAMKDLKRLPHHVSQEGHPGSGSGTPNIRES